jgi:PleD family two-component response regulator
MAVVGSPLATELRAPIPRHRSSIPNRVFSRVRTSSISSDSGKSTTPHRQSFEQVATPSKDGTLYCMIADDNPVACKIMETMLNKLNCHSVIVRNGAEAIRCAMGNIKFDIIFMDIVMPIGTSTSV